MVQILSVDTHLVSVRVSQQPFLMDSGLTSLIMMHPPSLLSRLRGILGMSIVFHFSRRRGCISVWILYLILFLSSFRYVDAIMTIPKGTLFPMCGMNLGFNRELIGPAMYFGLMGDGQPLGRYDDMWAGWCTKVCWTIHCTKLFTFAWNLS